MRLILLAVAAILTTACSTTPSAERYVEAPLRQLEAQQREVRVAEARLRQLRTQIDLDDDVDADDYRAFQSAREELSRLRSIYPTIDSGYDDLGWHPLELLGKGTITTGGSTAPRGIDGRVIGVVSGSDGRVFTSAKLGLFSGSGG